MEIDLRKFEKIKKVNKQRQLGFGTFETYQDAPSHMEWLIDQLEKQLEVMGRFECPNCGCGACEKNRALRS